jgi:hypothetical protein
MEGVSMSKWEMNNLLGKDNNNAADYCSCKGGLENDNNNNNKSCKCSSKMTSYSYSTDSSVNVLDSSEKNGLIGKLGYSPVL